MKYNFYIVVYKFNFSCFTSKLALFTECCNVYNKTTIDVITIYKRRIYTSFRDSCLTNLYSKLFASLLK